MKIVKNISVNDAMKQCIRAGYAGFDYDATQRLAYFKEDSLHQLEQAGNAAAFPCEHYTLIRR